VFPIVDAGIPHVPALVLTDPAQAMANYDLRIFDNPDRTPPCVTERPARTAAEWLAWVRASNSPHFAVAEDNVKFYRETFTPSSPIFDQRIPIR
jgi:hypothetical protein